jgi:aminoglycoside phosphotransferase family enzyme/predicted kinase
MSASPQSQHDVFDFLSRPATQGGAFGDTPVQRIETHANMVFLAGDCVFKVKKAVRFPFLDYSTLAKREAACRAELAVNRRFAPEIYRGVVAITRDAGGKLSFDGDGETVEWAVIMRRFDDSKTLDRLADAGTIGPELADALARAVVRAHADAPGADANRWIASLDTVIRQNDNELRSTPAIFPPADVATLTGATCAALARVRPLLTTRGAQGLIRHCHGDLHLGNVVLIDGRPVLFDAIEFDPLIAAGDVLYDLAFLLMDLTARRLDRAANIVLNRYLADTGRDGDLDGLAALPLFMALRAAIRAKVTAARAGTSSDRETLAQAKAYFALALRLIAPPPPSLIAVGGLSGTGKSVLARQIAPPIEPRPGAVLLRSDVIRKTLFGVAETDPLPPDAYSSAVTERVYRRLAEQAGRVLAAGHSAVVDAVFARADERQAIAAAAGHAPFRGLFLTADLATRVARVGHRSGDATDADAAVARRQEAYDVGPLDWHIVDAAGTLDDTLANARAALGRQA